MTPLLTSFFIPPATTIAKKLLGKIIEYKSYSGIIVETEAYMNDSASHAYKITPRSKIMHETYGHIYIYFIYGSYFCLNITTNKGSRGAVLIRALEPLKGIKRMKKNRKTENIHNITSGPGKLCQAFGITKALNGTIINEKIKILDEKSLRKNEIMSSPRIGIRKSRKLEWRFFIKENRFVSKQRRLKK